MLDQQLGDLEMALLRRDEHGGDAVVAALVDVGAVLDQQLDDTLWVGRPELPGSSTKISVRQGDWLQRTRSRRFPPLPSPPLRNQHHGGPLRRHQATKRTRE